MQTEWKWHSMGKQIFRYIKQFATGEMINKRTAVCDDTTTHALAL